MTQGSLISAPQSNPVNNPVASVMNPLHSAIESSNRSELISLLSKKHDINAGITAEWAACVTALHFAMYHNVLWAVEMLLDHKANPNAEDTQGQTPLHYAAEGDKAELAKILLNKRADPNIKDHQGQTALHLAAINESEKCGLIILQAMSSSIDEIDHEQNTALHYSAKYGLTDLLKSLLDRRADPNLEAGSFWSKSGITPIHLACRNGELSSVLELFNRGANNLEAKDSKGFTPIHLAAERDHSEVVQWLIHNNVDAYALDNRGATPLHLASANGALETVKILIHCHQHQRQGPMMIDKKLRTPLHYATGAADDEEGEEEDPDDEEEEQEEEEEEDEEEEEEDEEEEDEDEDDDEDEENQSQIIHELVKAGSNPGAQDESEKTPLHYAALNDKPKLVQTLVSYKVGLEVGAQGEWAQNVTPLHMAAEVGAVDCAKILLNNGAKISAQDSELYTPLHYASENDHLDMVTLLVDRKAPIAATDRKGKTPLDYAKDSGSEQTAKYLATAMKASQPKIPKVKPSLTSTSTSVKKRTPSNGPSAKRSATRQSTSEPAPSSSIPTPVPQHTPR